MFEPPYCVTHGQVVGVTLPLHIGNEVVADGFRLPAAVVLVKVQVPPFFALDLRAGCVYFASSHSKLTTS